MRNTSRLFFASGMNMHRSRKPVGHDEIASILLPGGAANINRELLAAKAREIDATIVRLEAMSRSLKHAAVCLAQSHAERPTFQRLLRAAGKGELRRGVALRRPAKKNG